MHCSVLQVCPRRQHRISYVICIIVVLLVYMSRSTPNINFRFCVFKSWIFSARAEWWSTVLNRVDDFADDAELIPSVNVTRCRAYERILSAEYKIQIKATAISKWRRSNEQQQVRMKSRSSTPSLITTRPTSNVLTTKQLLILLQKSFCGLIVSFQSTLHSDCTTFCKPLIYRPIIAYYSLKYTVIR